MEWRSFSGFACPVLAVLFRLSLFGCLLFFLSRHCCPVLIVMLLLSCSDCCVMTVLMTVLSWRTLAIWPVQFCFPYYGCPVCHVFLMLVVLVMVSSASCPLLWGLSCPGNLVLDWLPCRGCPVQALISWSSCSGLSLLAVRSWLSCPSWPFLALLFRLSCPACSILPVLVFSRNSIMDINWNLDVWYRISVKSLFWYPKKCRTLLSSSNIVGSDIWLTNEYHSQTHAQCGWFVSIYIHIYWLLTHICLYMFVFHVHIMWALECLLYWMLRTIRKNAAWYFFF